MTIAERVLARLRQGPCTIDELAEFAYRGAKMPDYARNIVAQAIYQLRRKGHAVVERRIYSLAPRR